MVKRNPPRFKADDRAFPIRVKFVVPSGGLRALKGEPQLEDWLQANLGPNMWAWGPADSNACMQATAYYFRLVEDAERFVAAFPQLEMADGVGSPIDTTPTERTPHQGWSCLGKGA